MKISNCFNLIESYNTTVRRMLQVEKLSDLAKVTQQVINQMVRQPSTLLNLSTKPCYFLTEPILFHHSQIFK